MNLKVKRSGLSRFTWIGKKNKINFYFYFEFTFSNLLLVDLLFVDEPCVLVQGVGVVQAKVPGLEKKLLLLIIS